MTSLSSVRADGLRLAICSDTYLPQVNGVARTLGRLADTVRARGGDVRVFTTMDPAAERAEAIHRFPSIPFWAYPQLQLAAPPPAAIARELQQWGATLVHAATPFGIGLAARAAASRAGIPFVTSYHTSFSTYARFYRLSALSTIGWSFLRWFHNGGVRTYCPSASVARELREHGFQRVSLWTRGVDAEAFNPRFRSREWRARLGADDDTVVVAYVGRVALEKGLDVALEGMRRAISLSPRRIRFAIAGDGPWAEECRSRLTKGMVMLGELHGRELSELYASADLFVFPSVTDTFGNVVLEAMASGLPVVAADAGPTREVVGDSEACAFFSGRSAQALAETVCQLAGDDEGRARRGAMATGVARQRDWASVFDGLLMDYARVMGQASRSEAA